MPASDLIILSPKLTFSQSDGDRKEILNNESEPTFAAPSKKEELAPVGSDVATVFVFFFLFFIFFQFSNVLRFTITQIMKFL